MELREDKGVGYLLSYHCAVVFSLCITTGVIAERPIGFSLLSFTGLPQGVLIDATGRGKKKSVGDELVKQWLECLD